MTIYYYYICIHCCCCSYSLSEKKGGGGAAVPVPTCTQPPTDLFMLVYAQLAALIPTHCAHPCSSMLVPTYLCLFLLSYLLI